MLAFVQMVNILPMVKMYLFPFCKLSLPFGFEPRMSLVRSCPFYPPNGALNYHEFLENWTLTISSFPEEESPTNLFSFLVLFLLPTNLGDSICVVMIVPGGYWFNRGRNNLSSKVRIPKGAETVCEPFFVHGKKGDLLSRKLDILNCIR